MNLRYVNIWLNPETGFDKDYRYEFTLRTRFISNFLSKQIRNHRFVTDGTFHMISVNPISGKLSECRILPDRALSASVLFDQERYEKIKGTADYEYYLELLEEGFKKASKFKAIPLKTLLNLIDEFRNNGYKNEWQHKKKRFKEKDIEISLNCYFTTLDFRLAAVIKRVSTNEELCSGVILRTDPDEICFDKMFNDISINRENIIITDKFNFQRFSINLKDAFKKVLNFKLLENYKTI